MSCIDLRDNAYYYKDAKVGNERVNAKEIRLLLVQLQGQGSALSETKEMGCSARVQNLTCRTLQTYGILIICQS